MDWQTTVELIRDCGRMTGHSEPIVARLRSLIGGMDATGHEDEAIFPKKTQLHQIGPASSTL
jgi:hypothetical protein